MENYDIVEWVVFVRRRLTGFKLLGLMLVLFVLSGCTGGEKKSTTGAQAVLITEPQYDWGSAVGETLTLWCHEPELERSYMQKALVRYEELTGNRIEGVQFPKQEFSEKVEEALRSGSGTPDVILSYGGSNVEAFDPDINFYDFTDAVWVEDLTDTSINQAIYNGRIIGLPHWEASVSGMIYNKEIFSNYHIKVPETQEEFLSVCSRLYDNGIIPVFLPGAEISMLLYQFPLDSLVQDSDVLDAMNGNRLHYAEMPEMAKIVNWYREMAQKGYFGENYLTDSGDGMSEAMRSGRYAMMICWDTWLYTDFDGDASKFGLMPAFMGTPEEGTFEGPNLGLLIVNNQSKKLQTAVDFITFMADPYNYNVSFEGIYTAPVFKNQVASISTPQYIESQRLIDRHFRDSTAWLRIRGFSQMDASCILEYMSDDGAMTAKKCLQKMDILREQRLNDNPE